jgi:predicted DNA-binding transcriptional regulator AlpA
MATVTIQLTVTFGDEATKALAAALAPALREAMANAGRAAAANRRDAHNPLFAGQLAPEDQGLLIGSREVAALLNVSERHVAAMVQVGRVPPPIRIGHVVRWSRERVSRWIADGCPPPGEAG